MVHIGRVGVIFGIRDMLIRGRNRPLLNPLIDIPQVLYLVVVQLLDSRGGELQPPPPEAFGL